VHRHIFAQVVGWRFSRVAGLVGDLRLAEAVNAKGSPVGSIEAVGEEVPVAHRMHE
jgi:hypothetical protein